MIELAQASAAAAYRKPAASAAGGKTDAKKAAKFELTEEQKQEIREAFDLFDTDGSGEFTSAGDVNMHLCWP